MMKKEREREGKMKRCIYEEKRKSRKMHKERDNERKRKIMKREKEKNRMEKGYTKQIENNL